MKATVIMATKRAVALNAIKAKCARATGTRGRREFVVFMNHDLRTKMINHSNINWVALCRDAISEALDTLED